MRENALPCHILLHEYMSHNNACPLDVIALLNMGTGKAIKLLKMCVWLVDWWAFASLPLFSHSSKLVHLQTIIAFLQCTSLLLLRPCVMFILVLYTYPARVPYTEEGRRSNKGGKGKNFFCVPPPPPPSPHLSSSLPSLPHLRHITFLERGKKGCQKIDKKSHFGGGNCLNHCWQLSTTLTYFF